MGPLIRLAIFSKCKTGTHIANCQQDSTNVLRYISSITKSHYVMYHSLHILGK